MGFDFKSSSDGFIDLHLHALPRIDDGVKSVTDAVQMIRGLSDLGFTELVTTPHRDFQRWRYSELELQEAYESVQTAVLNANIPIRLGLGAEYTYGEQFHKEITDGVAKTIDSGRYILVELPEKHMPHSISSALFQVGLAGYYPILAHPERCRPFQDNVDALSNIASGRALVQVSFRSLAGTFGRTIKKTSWRLVEEGVADLVATDCHSPRELRKVVEPVLKQLHKRLNSHHFRNLLCDFPRTLIPTKALS